MRLENKFSDNQTNAACLFVEFFSSVFIAPEAVDGIIIFKISTK